MELFYATTNAGKIYNMKRIVRQLPIEIVTPKDLGVKLELEENGVTVVENAMKKAAAYYELVKMPTIAGDSSMYIAGLPEEKQPGLHVKRVGGRELTEEEAIEYYSRLIQEYGRREAWYVTGMVLIDGGVSYSAAIEEDRFILVSERDSHSHKVSPLDVLSIDPISGKYYSEMTDEEINGMGAKFDAGVLDFLKKCLL